MLRFRSLWGRSRASEHAVAGAANAFKEFAATNGAIWPYAGRYNEIQQVGHQNKAPAIGSPTLVWHMGVWPSRAFGEAGGRIADGEENAENPLAQLERRFRGYEKAQELFCSELNALLVSLQKRGRVAGAAIEQFEFKKFVDHSSDARAAGDGGEGDGIESGPWNFRRPEPRHVGFTIWWRDSAIGAEASAEPAQRERPLPDESDIRVRVECQMHRDHATIAFYIDALKPYGGEQIDHAGRVADGASRRRKHIIDYVDLIRETSHNQMVSGAVDKWRLPEKDVDPTRAAKLRDAADYLYEGVWREFMRDFGLKFALNKGHMTAKNADEYAREAADIDDYVQWRDDEDENGWAINRFADFRGLVMSMRGLRTVSDVNREAATKGLRDLNKMGAAPSHDDSTPWRPDPNVGTTGVGDLDEFDPQSNEGNTVLKSLWPFLRRMSPWADYRSFVGCGIISWRALYVSALGSTGKFHDYDEGPGRFPADVDPSLPEREAVWDLDAVAKEPHHKKLLLKREASRPQRFLIVTKGEPHREQIGRFVERINAVATMRLFALRNYSRMRNAGVLLELLGRELDHELKQWSKTRRLIEQRHLERMAENRLRIAPPQIREPARDWLGRPKYSRPDINQTQQDLEDLRIYELNDAVTRSERKLIALAGQLDNVGEGGSGRMLYVIERAQSFVREFDRLYPTLEIGDIKGWVSYEQFVKRGLRPTFDLIHFAGQRLVALRERLQTIMSTIQTTALMIEAEATRENTRQLKLIASYFQYMKLVAWPTGVLLMLWLLGELFSFGSGYLGIFFRRLLGMA
ncbi:MAG: hypothetical protein MRY74_10205 [Neomegalonema sp.]|nr:hypothetical protein [Neomegalonema sp.]